jgi:phage-related minor tail protein
MANEGENLKYLQDMNAAVFRNMEGAIENFVKTGKLNFKDLTRSIIADLMAIYLKAQILGVLKMMFPSISIASFLPGIAGKKADGGPVTGGSNYLVGERGPEMFVPSSSGTIIPNHKLSGDGSSGQQIIYNGPYIASMSAIDTQSATQFLAKNKSAVWAANQSAQRSVPVSR